MKMGQIQNRLNLYSEPCVVITTGWRRSLCYAGNFMHVLLSEVLIPY